MCSALLDMSGQQVKSAKILMPEGRRKLSESSEGAKLWRIQSTLDPNRAESRHHSSWYKEEKCPGGAEVATRRSLRH